MPYDITSFQEGFQWGLVFCLGAGMVGYCLYAVFSFFKKLSGG